MKTKVFLLFIIGVVTLLFTQCKQDVLLPPLAHLPKIYNPTPITIATPKFFPEMYENPNNPLTVEGVALGKKLYYDPKLSAGGPLNGMACAGCHLQEVGFTLPTTNVLAHVNLGWSKNFLWNGKIQGLLENIMMFEVNDFFKTDLNQIKTDTNYQHLYFKAFGSQKITDTLTAFALAQFIKTLVSANSKFDKYLRNEAPLTTQELIGFNIFNSEKGDCFHCHNITLFTDNDFHNIGLDSVFTTLNGGRYNITLKKSDLGKFKTPSLRNVALRKSFMHDGRFTSLTQVVNHYNNGVKQTIYLDPLFTKSNRINGSLGLNSSEVEALVAFLHTLTDQNFITNPAHAKP